MVLFLTGVIAAVAAFEVVAQPVVLERLDRALLDADPPSARVSGGVGEMVVQDRACRTDVSDSEIRRRIVNITVQEWGYFGFSVVDKTQPEFAIAELDFTLRNELDALLEAGAPATPDFPRRLPRPDPAEVRRTAAPVAGFWAVTPEGPWIVANQNDVWNRPDAWSETGRGPRWSDPWSAAFVSWVMCEAGLGTTERFERAVAHRVYIDQAIGARDGRAAAAAFVARDLGEATINPGDLLCSSRAPVYGSIAERRRDIGHGARSHCDIVVAIDVEKQLILAIGGNVRGTVALKIFPAIETPDRRLRPDPEADDERHIMFAHLELRAEPVEADALSNSPTIRTLVCQAVLPIPEPLVTAGLSEMETPC